MAGRERRPAEIERLNYRPSAPYRLDLEIFSVSDLRQRVGTEELRSTHQYAFHLLLCVTRGECTHRVDFRPVHCKSGSLLALRPGQAHSFGLEEDWDGWMVLFREEFILSSPTVPDLKIAVDLDRLHEHLSLRDPELRIVTSAIAQMREDARIEAPAMDVHALLRYQLYALLLRLGILYDRQEAQTTAGARALQRFKRFQKLVEKNFAKWHQVAEYADELGCSVKSLTRATKEVVGMNAKAFIVSRISLEAKRLLAHTALSVSSIGDSLGFEEATNFIKFFKRETGCSPAEFRRRQNVVIAPDRARPYCCDSEIPCPHREAGSVRTARREEEA
jgi:AraC-like DNA-binding protein